MNTFSVQLAIFQNESRKSNEVKKKISLQQLTY